MGSNILDYTLLTQQVWSHVLLSPNLLGGFTTQNTGTYKLLKTKNINQLLIMINNYY